MLISQSAPVLVVGGGIAGLAVARALDAQSLPFTVLERRAERKDDGLAIVLPGNAIRALTTLGCGEHIRAIGHPIRCRQYRTATDRLLCEIDEDRFWGQPCRPRCVRRSALIGMLGAGLPEGTVRLNTGVEAIGFHPTHADVWLTTGYGLSAGLLVGADGVHSTVRAQVFGDDAGVGGALLARSSWRFMAPNPGIDCWTLWTSRRGMILLVPVDDQTVYGWAALTRSPEDGVSPDALEQLASRFPDRVRRAVTHAMGQTDGLYHSPLEDVRLRSWHHGRAVLVGDAAHATAPVWAQGAALALEDAIVLTRTLGAHEDVEAALVDFQNQRWKRVAHVQATTDAMSKAAKLPTLIRNALLPSIAPRRYRQTYEPLKVAV